MASQLVASASSNPIIFKLALQLHAIQKSLKSLGQSPVEKDDKGKPAVVGQDTDDAVQAAAPSVVNVVSAVGLVSGAITMYFYASIVLDFAALCLVVMASVTAFQKWRLQRLGDLRGQHNALREKCNVLARENNHLRATVNEMESQLERLADVEKGLSKIARESGTQVDRLVEIVKENGALQAKVKKALERQVMQQIIDAVVTSDKDGNFTLAPRETEMLKARLQNIGGVVLNQQNFDNMIASDKNELTVSDVMNIVRNLLDDNVPTEDNVFVLDPESLLKKERGTRSIFPW